MPVSSLGVGSGLELGSLMDKLLAAEANATTSRLNTKEVKAQAKISAYGSLNSALSGFNSAVGALNDVSKFQTRTVDSSAPEKFTATASSEAASGQYSISVSSVAKAQQLKSSSYESDAVTNLGGGSMTFEVDGESFSITLDDSASSLNKIRDAVNKASDNVGIKATVINSNSGSKIIFSSDKVGTSNTIKITTDDNDSNDTDTAGLSKLAYDVAGGTTNMAEYVPAANASVTINGEVITSTSSNEISSAIQGVSITVKDVTSSTGTIKIIHDKNAVFDNVNKFIKAYNSLQGTVESLSSYNSETKKGGALLGDPTLRSISTRMARAVSAEVEGLPKEFNSLSDVGISFNKKGQLVLDSTTLNKALDSNFNAVGELFANKKGTENQQQQLNSNNYAASTTVVGQGTLAFSVGSNSFNVTVGAGEETLAGVRDAINNASGNTSVKASLRSVQGSSDFQLVLTANTAGDKIQLTTTDNDGNNTDTTGLSALAYNDDAKNLSELQASSKEVFNGVGNTLEAIVKEYIGSSGSVESSKKVLNDEVSRINDERKKLELRLQKMQDRLTAKFTNLDILLTQMNRTSSFLTQQLEAIAQIGKKK